MTTTDPIITVLRPCSVCGVDRGKGGARGLCGRHYAEAERNGTLPPMAVRPSLEERFWSKVNKDGPVSEYAPHRGPCWLWTAGQNGDGYGAFRVSSYGRASSRGVKLAHIVAWTMATGKPVPPGLELDHLCRVRACVRWDHMEAVTKAVNILRGFGPPAENARRTACPCGLPYEFALGQRICRSCYTAYHQARHARRARRTTCSNCGLPYDERLPNGRPRCRPCYSISRKDSCRKAWETRRRAASSSV